MAVSLPQHPDLERFRRDARRLQRGLRAGDPDAIALHTRLHPDGTDAPTTLAAAQLTIARSVGLASWPRLREYLAAAQRFSRDPAPGTPATDPTAQADPEDGSADRYLRLACLTYAGDDHPTRWSAAAELLAADPDLTAESLPVAVAAGELDAVRRHLAVDPGAAGRDTGPHRWAPLLYLTYSRVEQQDPVGVAEALLAAGADPDAGFLWRGLTPPFTALTGCFGEGESGPGRQPRHPQGEDLARTLLAAGAAVNDGQTLYNRMFGRDDGHLRLLFEFGLGSGDLGAWGRRLGAATETVEQMMRRQVDWAHTHGMTDRLALLAEHGFVPEPELGPDPRAQSPAIHLVSDPTGVGRAAAAGADLDALLDGRTALHGAAFRGDLPLIAALLAAGADPTVRDVTHHGTPLDWAEYACQPAAADLLRRGAGQIGGDVTGG